MEDAVPPKPQQLGDDKQNFKEVLVNEKRRGTGFVTDKQVKEHQVKEERKGGREEGG